MELFYNTGMTKRKITEWLAFVMVFSLLFIFQAPLWGWSRPITVANDSGYTYEKPQVKYDSSGTAYVSYTANTVGSKKSNIFLSRFDGRSVEFVKNVSETSNHAYEGDVGISASGRIHLAWVEYAPNNPTTQSIKYRSYSGSWSTIQTLGQVTSTDLVEDLRMAVDRNNNVFVVFMVWPAGRCQFISKYGSAVSFQNFPVTGRSKHPDVAVDDRYVYIAWQHLVSSRYTILSQKKNNVAGGSWLATQDLRHYDTQRPRTDADSSYNPHVIYWHDLGATRKLFYKYWRGTSFSSSQVVSDPSAYYAYHFADFEVKGTQMIATMQMGGYYGGRAIYYNWANNGVWGGLRELPGTLAMQPTMASVDMTSAYKVVIAVASTNKAVYLIQSEGDAPEPPPPAPEANLPPTATFSFTPLQGLYPLSVNFNAKNSRDSDGQIVSYNWDFGDGAKGSGSAIEHVYQGKNRFRVTLTVTDDDGASATATGEVEVFGLYPPLDVQFARYENRNLFSIEYLYKITWSQNPNNIDVGASIVAYKIYRRLKGSSYGYGHFYTYPSGGQPNYEYLDRSLGRTAYEYEYRISSVDGAGRESDLN